MNYKQKLKLARKFVGSKTGGFTSFQWFSLKMRIENKVQKTIFNQKLASKLRKEKQLKGGEKNE